MCVYLFVCVVCVCVCCVCVCHSAHDTEETSHSFAHNLHWFLFACLRVFCALCLHA